MHLAHMHTLPGLVRQNSNISFVAHSVRIKHVWAPLMMAYQEMQKAAMSPNIF